MLRARRGVLLMPVVREAGPGDRDAIRALLLGSGLPADDLDASGVELLVAVEGDTVLGAIGLERHGDAGLLRSAVLAPRARGTGLGRALVAALEERARMLGVPDLVLLTQTAAPFFAHLGYAAVDRASVPERIRGSAEFRTLCPASATCMAKRLAPRRRVLFVCVENSNRSQMAEAFARRHGGALVEAASAGSAPSGRINPKAIRFMGELGYDLASHRSKSLDDVSGEFDAVVTMGCGDRCPWIPARRREDWALADPRDMDDAGYRAVRDDIEARVKALLASL